MLPPRKFGQGWPSRTKLRAEAEARFAAANTDPAYEPLKLDDQVCAGDEVWQHGVGPWAPATTVGHVIGLLSPPYRRKKGATMDNAEMKHMLTEGFDPNSDIVRALERIADVLAPAPTSAPGRILSVDTSQPDRTSVLVAPETPHATEPFLGDVGRVLLGPWRLAGAQIRAKAGLGPHVATYQRNRAEGELIASAPELADLLFALITSREGEPVWLAAHERATVLLVTHRRAFGVEDQEVR